jgi:steroid 5-alpha reductase family enzyme
MVDAILITSGVILMYVSVLFCISIVLKRNDIADTGWGVGIFLVGLSTLLYTKEQNVAFFLVLFFVFLWAMRLSVRIFRRNRKKGEDVRYRKWREEWGRAFYLRSYFQIYILQGFLMIVVGYPLIHTTVFGFAYEVGVYTIIGAFVWLFGFLFEAVSDAQLDSFLSEAQNKGKLMRYGLWKYSRHPNYFGEVVLWWGIWLMVVPTSYGVVVVVSPLTITFLILYVSGIPMLESHMATHPEFEDYKKTTSVFIPLSPRKVV